MSIKSVICGLFGLAFILVPAQTMSLYSVTLAEGGLLMTRLFGAAFIVLALWLGLARDTEELASKRAVAISVTVGDVIGCAIMVYAIMIGSVNALGWLTAILYLLLAIGFGYTLVSEPEGKLAV